jgi:hypothetical protein
MIVRCQFWSQRVRFGTIEHIGDRLAFLRSEGGDVDEGLHFLIPCGRDYGPGISVGGNDYQTGNSLQGALKGRRIIGKRSQGQRRR